jgi:organic radical activating enzyme
MCAPISRRLPAMRNFIRPTVFASVTARSSPLARSRSLGLPRFRALVDDAVREGFTELYVTGGEPFLERDLVEMLLYATERLDVVCLTNAMLYWRWRRTRLERLAGRRRLILQTSLDGAQPSFHDANRGAEARRTQSRLRDAVATRRRTTGHQFRSQLAQRCLR